MLERREIHCIIRNTGSGWFVLNDADHEPIGVTGITQFADKIYLNFDFTAKKIHSFHVTPDETYAAVDQYRAGASVSYTYAEIWFAKPGINVKVNPALIKNPGGNFFVSGWVSVEVEDEE